jgi:Toprim domain-containing protein
MNSVLTTDNIEGSYVTERHREIAARLSVVHGKVRLATESNGVHAYMASPACLEKYGRTELVKMHLAVNLDKWLQGVDLCALCMKTNKAYKVTTLLRLPPLEMRGMPDVKPGVFEAETNPEYLELDARGNRVPKSPGECQLLTELPPEHPAIEYCKYRGFEPEQLVTQFRASFCSKERDDLHWRPLPGGFAATPQGRIVFFMDQNGIQAGWQARILEMDRKHSKYYLHPYEGRWVAVQQRLTVEQDWTPMPGFEDWDPAKYLLAYGTKRNAAVMGLDAAIAFNKLHGGSWCVLCEGPLDAARFGAPAIAVMGKHLSEMQAKLISDNFSQVIFVGDNDEAGKSLRQKVFDRLGAHPGLKLLLADLPLRFKDAGDMKPFEAKHFLCQALVNIR